MSVITRAEVRRIVVKLGTGVLTSGIGQLHTERIQALATDMAALRAEGIEVIVVSSGAVGLGMGRLGLTRKPGDLAQKQACAAIGQSLLMQTWQSAFAPHAITVAQVLLTHEDLRARKRYLGVQACLEELIAYNTLPVINENDTVSTAELKFGDNDTLAAMVASLLDAQYLAIISKAPGLIDLKGSGEVIPTVEKITPEIEAMAGGTTDITATGGMISKISAAKLATRAGCGVFIASGAEPHILTRLLSGGGPGTFFMPSGLRLDAKKRWIAYFHRPRGLLRIDARAVPVLRREGRSLLAIGLTGADGDFSAGDVVDIAGPDGLVLARGITAFSAKEITLIAGKNSDDIRPLYPQRRHLEVVHRNELVLL